MNRWVKLYCKTLNWEWFSDTNTWHVFSYLLLRATWDCAKERGVELKPGQVVTSVAEIGERTGLSARKIRTALEHLKATNEVTIKATNRKSVITIENWGKYQSAENKTTNKTTNNLTTQRQTIIKDNKTIKEKSMSNDIDKKKTHGEFQNVKLSDREYERLIEYVGSEHKAQDLIERLSSYMASRGKKYKSHYATMQNWYRKEQDELSRSTGEKTKTARTDKRASIPQKWLEQLTEQGQVERSI